MTMDRTGKLMAMRAFLAAKFVLICGSLILSYFLAGLQHFVLTLPMTSDPATPATDGIVVITGGQQRLADGIRLLQSGAGEALLVSGVGSQVTKAILAEELGLDAPAETLLDCCVTLEFVAGDTRGNALAAAQWSVNNEFQSLRVVTANYHMPRAKYVFTRQMPKMKLYFWPVNPSDLNLETWWQKPAMIRLLAREFAKHLTEPFRV